MLCMEAGARLHQHGMVFVNAGADLSLQDVSAVKPVTGVFVLG